LKNLKGRTCLHLGQGLGPLGYALAVFAAIPGSRGVAIDRRVHLPCILGLTRYPRFHTPEVFKGSIQMLCQYSRVGLTC
jgi:hypothetical protein